MNEAGEQLATSGAVRFPKALGPGERTRIAALFGCGDRPGRRLGPHELASLADLIRAPGAVESIAATFLGPGAQPVRALLLDKSPSANRRLGWHQDRTIAVMERIDVAGFGPWSVKAGQVHVQPPASLLERMITLRVHVDDVDAGNAPLQVIPGSHRLGRLTEEQVVALAAECPRQSCLADSGDIWAYSTLILHASAEQQRFARRRVLQLDYSTDHLPGGLSG